jgi:hypothetical protein
MLNVAHLALLGFLASALHWLFARSHVMEWFWSRATGRLAQLLACPACSGWWLGLGLGVAGIEPVTTKLTVLNVAITGLLGLWLTPVFEAVLLWGLNASHIEQGEAPAPSADEQPPVG